MLLNQDSWLIQFLPRLKKLINGVVETTQPMCRGTLWTDGAQQGREQPAAIQQNQTTVDIKGNVYDNGQQSIEQLI